MIEMIKLKPAKGKRVKKILIKKGIINFYWFVVNSVDYEELEWEKCFIRETKLKSEEGKRKQFPSKFIDRKNTQSYRMYQE